MKNFLFLALISFAISANAQDVNTRQKHFLLEHGVAISGYDAVSYSLGKPQKGKASFTYDFNGIKYQFANAANLETFKKMPSKYEPAYGGWCAYAMGSSGEKVEVDPESYKIINGTTHLFYKSFINNTLNKWNDDEAKLKKQADGNWGKTFH